MSFLRKIMKMSKDEPAPEGSFKFNCLRMVAKYDQPVQVEYVDRYSELEIAVEEIANQGPLMGAEVCTVSLAELVGYGKDQADHRVRWGGIGDVLFGITLGDIRIRN